MNVNVVVVLATICLMAICQADQLSDIEASVRFLVREVMERKVYERRSERFVRYATCATDAPAASLPLADLPGVSTDVSGDSRCALYCQDLAGCKGYNVFASPQADGNQCRLYTTAPTNFALQSDECQYFRGTIDLCVDPCTNSPCKNGGTCSWVDFHFECKCPAGAIGSTCETKPCDPNPCQNSGVCTVTATSFSCACVGGYTGNTCATYPYAGYTFDAGSNAYYKSLNIKLTFTEAVARCLVENSAAHLPAFYTPSRYASYLTYLRAMPANNLCNTDDWIGYWLALRRLTTTCTSGWIWDLGNGNTQATVASDWGANFYTGEPSCGGIEFYVNNVSRKNFQLNDTGATATQCVICQIFAT